MWQARGTPSADPDTKTQDAPLMAHFTSSGGRKAGTMDFEQVKQTVSIREYAEQHLKRAGRNFYVCPSCHSGEKANKSAAMFMYSDHFYCYSCHRHGDVFDLAGLVSGTEDRAEQYRHVCEWAGIPTDGDRPSRITSRAATARANVATVPAPPKADEDEEKKYADGRREASAYIEACRANVGDPEAVAYIERRGFTLDEARAFGWGYDPEKHALVLPYGPDAPYYYTRRYLRKGTGEDGKYYKPPVDAVGPSPLCGMSALDRARVVFVVEGLMDAYALMACGVEAIALNGTSNAKRTAEAVVEAGYGGCVVLLLDNDKAGEEAFREMDAILEAGGVVHRKAAEFSANDAGDYLAGDRDGLSRYLSGEEWEATRYLEEGAEERYSAALASMRVVRPYDAMTRIWGLEDCEEPIPTGFSGIDKALDGGLRSGLYVLGAVSSLGKTTLAVQIADNIARSGRPVLFVTIEQSAREIVSKSLSRLMRAHGVAMPTRAINSRGARASWNGAATEAFEDACMDYCEVSLHLNILEGVKQPTVFDVQAVAETIARHEGTPPVVFIDYLQLLAPQGERDTEKQATDKNVMSLRQMARDLKTPLFIISSLNRSSYSGSISLDSFKESGAIEYGADVLLGLQPYGMADRMEDEAESKARREAGKIMREAKASNERQCELMILKQRDGGTPRDGIPLTFIPVSSAFFDNIKTSAADLPRKARAVI